MAKDGQIWELFFTILWFVCRDVAAAPVWSRLHSVSSQSAPGWPQPRGPTFPLSGSGHPQACSSHSSPHPHILTLFKGQELSHIPLDWKLVGQVSLQGQTPMNLQNYTSGNVIRQLSTRPKKHMQTLTERTRLAFFKTYNNFIATNAVYVAFSPSDKYHLCNWDNMFLVGKIYHTFGVMETVRSVW